MHATPGPAASATPSRQWSAAPLVALRPTLDPDGVAFVAAPPSPGGLPTAVLPADMRASFAACIEFALNPLREKDIAEFVRLIDRAIARTDMVAAHLLAAGQLPQPRSPVLPPELRRRAAAARRPLLEAARMLRAAAKPSGSVAAGSASRSAAFSHGANASQIGTAQSLGPASAAGSLLPTRGPSVAGEPATRQLPPAMDRVNVTAEEEAQIRLAWALAARQQFDVWAQALWMWGVNRHQGRHERRFVGSIPVVANAIARHAWIAAVATRFGTAGAATASQSLAEGLPGPAASCTWGPLPTLPDMSPPPVSPPAMPAVGAAAEMDRSQQFSLPHDTSGADQSGGDPSEASAGLREHSAEGAGFSNEFALREAALVAAATAEVPTLSGDQLEDIVAAFINVGRTEEVLRVVHLLLLHGAFVPTTPCRAPPTKPPGSLRTAHCLADAMRAGTRFESARQYIIAAAMQFEHLSHREALPGALPRPVVDIKTATPTAFARTEAASTARQHVRLGADGALPGVDSTVVSGRHPSRSTFGIVLSSNYEKDVGAFYSSGVTLHDVDVFKFASNLGPVRPAGGVAIATFPAQRCARILLSAAGEGGSGKRVQLVVALPPHLVGDYSDGECAEALRATRAALALSVGSVDECIATAGGAAPAGGEWDAACRWFGVAAVPLIERAVAFLFNKPSASTASLSRSTHFALLGTVAHPIVARVAAVALAAAREAFSPGGWWSSNGPPATGVADGPPQRGAARRTAPALFTGGPAPLMTAAERLTLTAEVPVMLTRGKQVLASSLGIHLATALNTWLHCHTSAALSTVALPYGTAAASGRGPTVADIPASNMQRAAQAAHRYGTPPQGGTSGQVAAVDFENEDHAAPVGVPFAAAIWWPPPEADVMAVEAALGHGPAAGALPEPPTRRWALVIPGSFLAPETAMVAILTAEQVAARLFDFRRAAATTTGAKPRPTRQPRHTTGAQARDAAQLAALVSPLIAHTLFDVASELQRADNEVEEAATAAAAVASGAQLPPSGTQSAQPPSAPGSPPASPGASPGGAAAGTVGAGPASPGGPHIQSATAAFLAELGAAGEVSLPATAMALSRRSGAVAAPVAWAARQVNCAAAVAEILRPVAPPAAVAKRPALAAAEGLLAASRFDVALASAMLTDPHGHVGALRADAPPPLATAPIALEAGTMEAPAFTTEDMMQLAPAMAAVDAESGSQTPAMPAPSVSSPPSERQSVVRSQADQRWSVSSAFPGLFSAPLAASAETIAALDRVATACAAPHGEAAVRFVSPEGDDITVTALTTGSGGPGHLLLGSIPRQSATSSRVTMGIAVDATRSYFNVIV